MDKYQAAIVRYENARLNIKNATEKINYFANGYFDGEIFVNDNACKCYKDGETCIEKLWDANTQNDRVDECFNHHHYDCDCAGGEIDVPDLCESCVKVQFYVDERKMHKKELGIAKRQISALAKGIIKNG